MKRKGGLDDFKLHYEALPSEPKSKKKPQTKPTSKKNILEQYIHIGPTILFPYIFQNRLANRHTVLSNVDDRKNMPKMPQANKKRTTKPKR